MIRRLVAAAALAAAALSAASRSGAASSGDALPPERAAEILSLKNRGLALLEEGKNREAQASFAKLAALVPGEPLPAADGAVAALRSGDLASAARLLSHAESAGPPRADLVAIGAAVAHARNDAGGERALLAKAAALSPRDLESRWRWIRSAEIDPAAKEDLATPARYLAEIVRASPANVPAWTKLLLLRLSAGDPSGAREAESAIEKILAPPDPRVAKFLAEGRDLLRAGKLPEAAIKFRIVENLLRVTDRYRQSLSELYTDIVGLPLEAFSPAFEQSLRPKAGAPVAVSFSERSAPAALDPEMLLRRVDLANDGRPALYPVPAPFRGAAFADLDLDGDLDVYLFGSGGPDRFLRNNLDGSWADETASTGNAAFSSSRVVAADVDRDGDPDLVCVTSRGTVEIRSNLRQGRFETVPLGVADAVDVAVGDVDADGLPDLVVATKSALVLLVNRGGGRFERAPGGDLAKLPAGFVPRRVILADLDNDGFPDVVAGGESGLAIWRNAGLDTFTAWPVAPRGVGRVDEIAAYDADRDGDLDLLVTGSGRTRLFDNGGGNANAWLDVTLEGLASGSGKVNREGVGSLVEVKAGNLYVARTVTTLVPTHFGLGKRAKADVVRCVWTNGVPQNLIDQKGRSTVREVQQLKGSCPFVYALDGRSGRWSFVSDALGRAPIGLLYDGVHAAGADPREWLKIDGTLLAPDSRGVLALDYTEELWEAAFLDMARLLAVDHPEGTDFVPNERMVPGILEKKIFTVARPRPVARAQEDGEDVTALLRSADHRYVVPGRETAYQGVRTEHALVLDLGPLPSGARVMLYLEGWIFYTDTSINVSIAQRRDVHPLAPVLEAPDGRGGWRVAIESLGFPAGKTKTMPVDLTGIVDPRDPRVRIRTTMAVWWDRAFVTVDDPPVETRVTELAPARASLAYRGFSRRYRETPDGPELFEHDAVDEAPHWADVPGRLTRYGDVTPLLLSADDRWVAFADGDAIRIEYDGRALPPLSPGWRRDWVLVSDGWDKDFDKNTLAGATVGPYPYHAMPSYPYPGSAPFPDPAFLDEWVTRAVSPDRFDGWVRDSGEPALR